MTIADIRDEPDTGDTGRELIDAAARKRQTRRRRRSSHHPPTGDATPGVRKPPRRTAEAETRQTTRDLVALAAAEQQPVPLSSWMRTLGVIALVFNSFAFVVMVVIAGVFAPPRPVIEQRLWQLQDGPRLDQRVLDHILSAYPERARLDAPDEWILRHVHAWLSKQDAVAAVHHVSWQLIDGPRGTPQGRLVIAATLREPVLPAVDAHGRRAWLADDGRLLPAELQTPAGQRPIVRLPETLMPDRYREASEAWLLLGPHVEAGLITAIELDSPISDTQRGIVMITRHGTRIVWGLPRDAALGMTPAIKASGLLRILAAQGDLSRLKDINVRWRDPAFTVRR